MFQLAFPDRPSPCARNFCTTPARSRLQVAPSDNHAVDASQHDDDEQYRQQQQDKPRVTLAATVVFGQIAKAFSSCRVAKALLRLYIGR